MEIYYVGLATFAVALGCIMWYGLRVGADTTVVAQDVPMSDTARELTEKEYERYKAALLETLRGFPDQDKPQFYVNGKMWSAAELVPEVLKDSQIAEEFVIMFADEVALTPAEYQRFKDELIEKLMDQANRDQKSAFTEGGADLSVNEIIDEIRRDTDLGRDQVQEFAETELALEEPVGSKS